MNAAGTQRRSLSGVTRRVVIESHTVTDCGCAPGFLLRLQSDCAAASADAHRHDSGCRRSAGSAAIAAAATVAAGSAGTAADGLADDSAATVAAGSAGIVAVVPGDGRDGPAAVPVVQPDGQAVLRGARLVDPAVRQADPGVRRDDQALHPAYRPDGQDAHRDDPPGGQAVCQVCRRGDHPDDRASD